MITKAQIQLINGLRIKKFRQKYNQFVVEGAKAVNELIISSAFVTETLFATTGWEPPQGFDGLGIPVEQVKAAEMERISQHQSAPDVVAVVNMPQWKLPVPADFANRLGLLLDDIQDPGNLGTMVRIADWYGITDIICSANSVDIFNAKAIAASMGSFLRVRVHYTELPAFAEKSPVPLYGCVMDGDSVYTAKKAAGALIVIGNEGHGISEALLHLLTDRISIPRFGGAESLNAAVATAIVLDNFRRG